MMRIFLAWILFTAPLCAGVFDDAVRAYEGGRFGDAFALFEKALAEPGADRGAVLVNLGHCAFHLGKKAEAVLYYRRALRERPDDSLLRGDLNVAEDLLGIDEKPFDFDGLVSRLATERSRNFCAFGACVLLLGAFVLSLRARRRGSVSIAAFLFALVGMVFVVATVVGEKQLAMQEAVVIRDGVTIYSEPSRERPVVCAIASGRTIRIEAMSDRWILARFGSVRGWLPRDVVGIVE